jgi:hypothetical protein
MEVKNLVKKYSVKIVREAGPEPITGQLYSLAEEYIQVDATSPQMAHLLAQRMTTLVFRGQTMRVFVDGEEHFDERL